MGSEAKTHHTAAVIIPPQSVWRPIQLLRARYDRKVARWMPHITLAYPFRPRAQFEAVAGALGEALRPLGPFRLELARFFHFEHPNDRYTLWLEPEPREPLLRIEEALTRALPDCNDVSRYSFGFTPHLSIGQVDGAEAMERLKAALQRDWEPVCFAVTEVTLVWRGEGTEDVFRPGVSVRLGGGEGT
jgi:2'-5' RNA ligase